MRPSWLVAIVLVPLAVIIGPGAGAAPRDEPRAPNPTQLLADQAVESARGPNVATYVAQRQALLDFFAVNAYAEVVRTAELSSSRPARVARGGGYPRGCVGECIPKVTPCALPDFICRREAGSVNVWNHGGSGASGKYQFMPQTWAGYGGYANAADAPESVQDERAAQVSRGGCHLSPWGGRNTC